MQRVATSRSFFNPATTRGVEEILSIFAANKAAMTPFIGGGMMRNIGVAARLKRPENRLNFSDARFVELVEFQTAAMKEATTPQLVTAIAEGFASFPSNEETIALVLTPLAERTAEATVRLIGNLSPDQLSVLVRALSFRGPQIFTNELRGLVTTEIAAKIDSLAHHNVREIMQAMRQWPVDAESAKIGNLLLRRLRNSLATISGSDALKLLVVLQRSPNYLRVVRGDLKPRLVELASREFEFFSLANKLQYLEVCAENRQMLSDEQIKQTTGRLASLTSEISGNTISDWMKIVALLRTRLNDFDAVSRKFVEERLATASFREKVDALWSLARLRGVEDVNFLEIFMKTVRPDSQLKLTEEEKPRTFQLLDIVAATGMTKFPISWTATLVQAEQDRVSLELRSKIGNLIERNLPAGQFAKNVAVGEGQLYRVPFFNEKDKIAVDIEPRNFRLHFNLKQKTLNDQGIKLVIIPDGAFMSANRQSAPMSEADILKTYLDRATTPRS